MRHVPHLLSRRRDPPHAGRLRDRRGALQGLRPVRGRMSPGRDRPRPGGAPV